MIVQNVSHSGHAAISFTVPEDEAELAASLAAAPAAAWGEGEVQTDAAVAKLTVSGVGLRSHTGVGLKLFAALAEAGVNAQLIGTSEMRVSVVVAADEADRAVAAVRAAFELGDPVATPVPGVSRTSISAADTRDGCGHVTSRPHPDLATADPPRPALAAAARQRVSAAERSCRSGAGSSPPTALRRNSVSSVSNPGRSPDRSSVRSGSPGTVIRNSSPPVSVAAPRSQVTTARPAASAPARSSASASVIVAPAPPARSPVTGDPATHRSSTVPAAAAGSAVAATSRIGSGTRWPHQSASSANRAACVGCP